MTRALKLTGTGRNCSSGFGGETGSVCCAPDLNTAVSPGLRSGAAVMASSGTGGLVIEASTASSPSRNAVALVAATNLPPVFSAMQARGSRASAFSFSPTTCTRNRFDVSLRVSAVLQTSALQVSSPSATRITSSGSPVLARLAASLMAAAMAACRPLGFRGPRSFS